MSEALLGVDLGTARIGIAVCEEPSLPAVPLATIAHTTWAGDIAAILELAAQRNATCIVVGNPIRMDGSSGPAAEKAAVFIRELQGSFWGKVIAQDERFSSAAASKKLRDIPLSGSKRRRHIDELAAVEILEAYLARARGS